MGGTAPHLPHQGHQAHQACSNHGTHLPPEDLGNYSIPSSYSGQALGSGTGRDEGLQKMRAGEQSWRPHTSLTRWWGWRYHWSQAKLRSFWGMENYMTRRNQKLVQKTAFVSRQSSSMRTQERFRAEPTGGGGGGRRLTGSRVGMGTLGGKAWSQPHLRLRARHPQTKGLGVLVAEVRPGCVPGKVGTAGQARLREQTA